MKTIKVYFGCALTHADESFKKDIEIVKDKLRKMDGVEMLDFIGLTAGTAQDVYEHDIHNCVKKGELIIAECSFPSTGLGWELGTAIEKHQKNVVAVARYDAKVTRLVLGAECERNPNYSFQTYSSLDELLTICMRAIRKLMMKNYSPVD